MELHGLNASEYLVYSEQISAGMFEPVNAQGFIDHIFHDCLMPDGSIIQVETYFEEVICVKRLEKATHA